MRWCGALSRHGPQTPSRISQGGSPAVSAVSISVTNGRNRGARRAPIFHAAVVRRRCGAMLGEACAKIVWQVPAWILGSNHFPLTHLPGETPQPYLVAGMKWLPGTYPSRGIRRPKLPGTLFVRRSKSPIGAVSGSGYRKPSCDYGPRNPARGQLTLG